MKRNEKAPNLASIQGDLLWAKKKKQQKNNESLKKFLLMNILTCSLLFKMTYKPCGVVLEYALSDKSFVQSCIQLA